MLSFTFCLHISMDFTCCASHQLMGSWKSSHKLREDLISQSASLLISSQDSTLHMPGQHQVLPALHSLAVAVTVYHESQTLALKIL